MWCQAPITESLPRCVPLNCQDKSHPPTLQMMKQRLWEGRGLAWLPPKGLKLEPEHNPRFAGAKFCDTAFLLKPGRFQQTKKFEKHWIEPSLKKIPYGRACQNFNKLIDWIVKRRVLYFSNLLRASLVAQLVKNPLAMWEPWVWSLGQEDHLEEGMATHYSILTWRIPWTEESGKLQSIGSERIKHDWSDLACNEWYWHTPILKISVWIGDVNLAMNIEIYKLCLYPVILLLSLSHEEIIWDPDTFKPQCWPHYYLCAFSC